MNIIINSYKHIHKINPYLQDSIVPLHLIFYNKEESCFSLHLNRFCWEFLHQKKLCRVNSCLHINKCYRVDQRNINKNIKTLNLLKLRAEKKNKEITIYMDFSDHYEIRLKTITPLHTQIWDYTNDWYTTKIPIHLYDLI